MSPRLAHLTSRRSCRPPGSMASPIVRRALRTAASRLADLRLQKPRTLAGRALHDSLDVLLPTHEVLDVSLALSTTEQVIQDTRALRQIYHAAGATAGAWSGGAPLESRWRSERDQPAAHGHRHGLGAAGRAGLAENRGHVEFHGVRRDVEATGDRPVAEPLGEHRQDLEFPNGQPALGVPRRA